MLNPKALIMGSVDGTTQPKPISKVKLAIFFLVVAPIVVFMTFSMLFGALIYVMIFIHCPQLDCPFPPL